MDISFPWQMHQQKRKARENLVKSKWKLSQFGQMGHSMKLFFQLYKFRSSNQDKRKLIKYLHFWLDSLILLLLVRNSRPSALVIWLNQSKGNFGQSKADFRNILTQQQWRSWKRKLIKWILFPPTRVSISLHC